MPAALELEDVGFLAAEHAVALLDRVAEPSDFLPQAGVFVSVARFAEVRELGVGAAFQRGQLEFEGVEFGGGVDGGVGCGLVLEAREFEISRQGGDLLNLAGVGHFEGGDLGAEGLMGGDLGIGGAQELGVEGGDFGRECLLCGFEVEDCLIGRGEVGGGFCERGGEIVVRAFQSAHCGAVVFEFPLACFEPGGVVFQPGFGAGYFGSEGLYVFCGFVEVILETLGCLPGL